MIITGITAEFDPLHNGHVYLMEKARALTGCDALVVAMSGDYVQRGGPAVIDKWARTEAALRSGADLVIEIPVLFCLGNASHYASSSVRLLEECGCSHIAFGSESGNIDQLGKAAEIISEHRGVIEERIRSLAEEGLSWPAARARAFRELNGFEIPDSPNDILALEYVMNMKNVVPIAVLRDNRHDSASVIRERMQESRDDIQKTGGIISGSVPEASADVLEKSARTFPNEWTMILRYAVMSSCADDLEDCPSGGEGLGNLLVKAAASEKSFEDIIAAVKSKRYTYTRISRLCMQAILGLTRTKYPYEAPEYIRVLGFTEKGRMLLSDIKDSESRSLPVITNINKESGLLSDWALRMLELDVHAADIYNLVTGRDSAQFSDHIRKPVMI